MTEITAQIQAAIPVPVTVKVIDMSWCGKGIGVDVYSNGDAGRTVVTKHQASDGVEAIVAAHLAARNPKAQKKSRQIADRVHRQVFGR